MHYIADDLRWLERSFFVAGLIYEIETYLWNWAEFERLYGP